MNKLIVVTGGTKGIGKAIIEHFAKNGFDIATCARQENDLSHLKTEIKRKYKTHLHYQVADLSKKESVKKFALFIKNLHQPVDVLVNNTGFFVPGSVVFEAEDNLEMMMNTNLYSAYYLSKYLLPDMMARKDGYVFNMCSVASIMAYPNGGSYSISKFALYGFTKVLREEMKLHGVRVSAVLPGATLTASWDGTNLPNDRFIKPEDVAEAVWSAYQMSKSSVVEEIIIRPQLGDI